MKNIKTILGALALATTLGVTQSQSATPNATIGQTKQNLKPVCSIEASADTNNYDNRDAGPAVRFQDGIALPTIRYGKMFPKNRELGNTAHYNPLMLDPLQFQSILNSFDCIPKEQYNTIINQIAAAYDSTKTELTLQYNDCKGENKELKVQLHGLTSQLDSSLTHNKNLQTLVRMDEAELNKFKTVAQPDSNKVATLDQIASEPIHPVASKVAYGITPAVYDGRSVSNSKSQESSSLGNSLGMSVYSAPGAGLNGNFGHFTLGLGIVKANEDKESSLETRTITNVPAPDYRTVYTEEASTQEETNQMAFLANLGYNFSKRFSLLAGFELASRETSGEQKNTIRHYIDGAQISEVSEIVPTERKTKTEVYPTFGVRLGLSDRLSLEGQYSTNQYFVGLNCKVGGSK